MKLSVFSIIWTFLYGNFGLGLLVAPIEFMGVYGVQLDVSGALMARILGSALIAFALVFWGNRQLPLFEKGWRNLLLASLVYNILDIPVVFKAVIDGVMNAMGWVPVGLHVFLAVTFGYFTFKKR